LNRALDALLESAGFSPEAREDAQVQYREWLYKEEKQAALATEFFKR